MGCYYKIVFGNQNQAFCHKSKSNPKSSALIELLTLTKVSTVPFSAISNVTQHKNSKCFSHFWQIPLGVNTANQLSPIHTIDLAESFILDALSDKTLCSTRTGDRQRETQTPCDYIVRQ